MGILTVISTDIESLVKEGFPDEYIAKSVDMDLSLIEYIINHFRKQYSKENKSPPKIKNK